VDNSACATLTNSCVMNCVTGVEVSGEGRLEMIDSKVIKLKEQKNIFGWVEKLQFQVIINDF
jgi:hypothetical protein